MSSPSASRAPARALPPHTAVQVSGDVIRAGNASRRFRPGDARGLLTAYLSLIRGVRDQRRARTIELRSADIEALAHYLGLSGSEVVERLAELMGATRTQRATMLTLFGTGALVIGLAGSSAVGRAQSAPGSLQPGVAVEATVPRPDTAVLPPTTIAIPTPATATEPPAVDVPATTTAPAPPEAPAPAVSDTEPPTIVDAPSNPGGVRSASAPASSEPVDEAAPEPEPSEPAPVPAPDDTVVTDIGTPPIPPVTEPTPDDSVVTDIGTPPIPPVTDPTPDDTVITDIGTPPIPPTTPEEVVVTDIGTPPVPPAG
jgi:hypothetical protein